MQYTKKHKKRMLEKTSNILLLRKLYSLATRE
ncbi:hypothetical protein CpecG_0857 [Chlamydia pecorum MC/MarsBar]|uniref:Uncharacterized protein n=1 Tax=Chlamydia pecorum (strain ATCC VR-628 / DSM 29919 / E58) TaxID=331635 RepID=A0AA34RDW8_CHLPE|nr:hypothetical protein G5S_0995 [Chlamydia pecorum E58]ETF37098.1 hypothetical protein CpecG_0857 [Chlamydia pecorum MC/MarsBar]ETF37247.1 hypothetical protein CpecF_0855 [Chlamydia pecorum DBDeUG]ETF39467.1 hypothetical protein CpecA_0856 [Chlamydia pecorum IPTaLE]